MVNLLTDYSTQIYHALSTDARPAANPGDQLREIDTGKRFIFDGTSWRELSDGGGGGSTLITKTITENGTYAAEDDNADGYSEVTVNVADGPEYTSLSAVSITTDGGNNNKVLFDPPVNVRTFDISYKLLSGDVATVNDVVLCLVSKASSPIPNAPYVNYPSSSLSVSFTTKEVVDGYVHLVGDFGNTISGSFVGIGGWKDGGYSRSNAFKYVKLYDTDGNLVFDAIPVNDNYGRPAFYDKVSKAFYYTYTGRGMVAGEAVV